MCTVITINRDMWVPVIGDEVVVRDWDDMVNEYGVDPYDITSIKCKHSFVGEMAKFCGVHYIITGISHDRYYLERTDGHFDDIDYYSISKDMLNPAGCITISGGFDCQDINDFLNSIPSL